MPLWYTLIDYNFNYLVDAVEYQPHFDKLDWLCWQWYQLKHVQCHQGEQESCHCCFPFVTASS